MLRTRIFLNLVPFVVILLAIGLYALTLFSRMATTVEASVLQNYRSVAAAHGMREAASWMETGLKYAFGNEQERAGAVSLFQKGTNNFARNLSIQILNLELPGERELSEALRANYLRLCAAGQGLLAAVPRRGALRNSASAEALPDQVQNLLVQIQVQIESLRQMNDESILKAGEQITRINDHITRLMVAGMGVALLISAFACFHLGRSILKPIQQLTRAARQIGEGKLEQQVPIRSRDELGQLAQTFNQMAAQLQAYRESTSEQIVRLHSTMKSALASFPDPIFVLNRQGRIELKNPAAEELSTQLGLGDSLPERLQETAAEVLNEGNDFLPHSFKDVVAFRVNGEEKFLLPRVLTMRGESQKSVGIAVVLHDVTRFRLLDDAKSNLVATVSHELKTPLTSVRMVLHLLLEKTLGTLTPRQEEMLETARKDAERLLRILNDLLDLARLDAGTPELRKEPMAPGALMGDLILEFEPLVAQQGLHLRRTVPESLPDVLVDRHRIAHVFRNFISNAIKHSPPGGEIHVQVRQTHNGGVQFSVLDQGPGVPEEYQGRIFDRFFRVPGQQKTGAGLGLSIAREITVAHGGRIGVRSEPGQGSEFFVVLPVAERAGDGEEIMN